MLFGKAFVKDLAKYLVNTRLIKHFSTLNDDIFLKQAIYLKIAFL
jgi:inactivated superfamily I helicase